MVSELRPPDGGGTGVRRIECGGCGRVVAETLAERVGGFRPCAWCGSADRRFARAEDGSIRGFNRWKFHTGRPKGYFLKVKAGDDYYAADGAWRKRYYVVDRCGDTFEGTFSDPATGGVLGHKR